MSKLFCGPEGKEMNIYISINGVVNRPRVCRRIKSNGGRICNDALNSDVILVEPSTGDGQEMVHFRGKSQPVLGYRWVEACIREEKFLGAEENWGGYRIHDSGEPLELRGEEDEDEGEGEEPDVDMHSGPRNILPTPRHTPTSPAVSQPPPSQPSYQSPPLPFSTPAPSNIPTMQPMPAMYPSTPFPQATQPIDPQAVTQMFQAFMMAAMSQGYAAPSPTFASGSTTAAPPPSQQPRKGKARATQPEALNPIFKENGKPLTFFVQVDLKNRISVISNIKKYGGKIISNNCDADYAVLHAGSKMFPQLLSGTTDAGRPAVKASFITDSIASGELEDASAYQFDVPLKDKKRASTSTIETPRPKRKGPNLVKVEQADVTPSLQPQIGIRSAAKKRKISTPTPSPARSTPSPTPPPESSRVEMAPGMYRYTEDEQAFMFRYFEYLVQFDGTTTTALTAKRLYERMPHHTIKSWSEYLRSHRVELEAIRKRIGIAKRKAQQLPNSQRESPSPPNIKTPYDIDMDHFCTFFAFGHGDNLEDEMVWDKLDKLHKCQTEPSWAAFNDRHNKVIFERVKEMTRLSG